MSKLIHLSPKIWHELALTPSCENYLLWISMIIAQGLGEHGWRMCRASRNWESSVNQQGRGEQMPLSSPFC